MIRSLVVCVDYADLLALTLPRNLPHFGKTLVVTSPTDEATQALAMRHDVGLFVTDVFYRHGAAFNKGAAIEAGFDVLGREGWIVHWDADIVMPADARFRDVRPGWLHMPRRRMCEAPAMWDGSNDWGKFPIGQEKPFVAGYFQLFDAADPMLRQRPWYPTHWRHAGGSDTAFCNRWPKHRRRWLSFEVLHLGIPCRNWWGRSTPYLDGSEPTESRERHERMRQMYRDRKRFGFSKEKL